MWKDRLCRICYIKEIDRVILECGHVICDHCHQLLRTTNCPMCRQPIAEVKPVILRAILNENGNPIENPTSNGI